MNAKQLCEVGDRLFGKRVTLLSRWQDVALNFYPQRADFTLQRVIGTELADGLLSSYPLLAHRSLSDTLGTMLRPTAKPWFHTRTSDERDQSIEARRWLELAEERQRRAMYDRRTNFVRATKEGDSDFAAFGQCAISVELNRDGDGLLYRCWHLRDMAWAENEQGKVGQIFRKWKPDARTLCRLFPGKVAQAVTALAAKDPFAEVECLHMVVESDMWDGKKTAPYMSIFYDRTNGAVLEETPLFHQFYVIPRWQTVSGSQYAYSPAVVAALPDARLIQAMTLTLLEAGEKYTNPPMIAVEEAIRSDVNIYAGGITAVESEYDERLGEVLRPLYQDRGGFPIGMELAKDCRAMIAEAFYLNKISMPQRAAEMTAYEVGQRVQEYIRGALPIFEPMETEYNGALCEMTFDLMMRAGAFGSPHDMPAELRGRDIQFRFESPLHDAIESVKEHKLLEAKAMLADALALDPGAQDIMDIQTALRDAMLGAGIPASWIRSEREAAARGQQRAQAQGAAATLDMLQKGANVANTLGQASQNLTTAPAPAPAPA